MKYACVGSGSAGNAAVIAHGDQAFLLDCGLSTKELVRRLDTLAIHPAKLLGVVVTHEHRDHSAGVAALARRFKLPVWMTHGTRHAIRDVRVPELHTFCAGQDWDLGPFHLTPFVVPHDAAEPCQFVVSHGTQRLGILTDLGMITPHVIEQLSALTGLVLECNHDETMLRNGPYPPALQARVGGHYGHLSNHQAAHLLKQIDTRALQFILLAHLSEKNNTPQKAEEAIAAALCEDLSRVSVLSQEQPSAWFQLGEA